MGGAVLAWNFRLWSYKGEVKMILVEWYDNTQEYRTIEEAQEAVLEEFNATDGEVTPMRIFDTETRVEYGCTWSVILSPL